MYTTLARFYDAFTENADYPERAAYFDKLIEKFGVGKGILLDLACGTGTLSFALERLGYDVIGTDVSEEMLDEALAKKVECGSGIIFLHQDMTALDMYGTVTATVCALDSMNHLESAEKVKKTFEKVSLFTEPGGVFIFDVNTAYKHREVLGNNSFIFENEDCFLAWQNEVGEDDSVAIDLDFFLPEGEGYVRESESFKEYYYSDEMLQAALESAGFTLCGIFEDLTLDPPREKCERKVFVAKKI